MTDAAPSTLPKSRIPQYDEIWAGIRAIAQGLIDSGETSLSRVVRLTEAAWRGMDARPGNGTAFGRGTRLPVAALIGGRQTLRTRVICAACRPDTSLVIELGSGPGLNLFDLFLGGAPRHARYFALEPTVSGRRCSEVLASLEPELDLAAMPFDYNRADYSGLPADQAHVLVFTSHSIETIEELPEEAISGLLGLGAAVTGVHFEPIGWQIREARGLPEAEVGSTRTYSEKMRYNRNLWALLSDMQQRGFVAIDTAEPDIIGHKAKNASSLVVWRSTGRPYRA